jgi:hypothetical protein
MDKEKQLKVECLRIACAIFQASGSKNTSDILDDAKKMHTWITENQSDEEKV